MTDAGTARIRIVDLLASQVGDDRSERNEVTAQFGQQSIHQLADALPEITAQSFTMMQVRQELLTIRGLLVI